MSVWSTVDSEVYLCGLDHFTALLLQLGGLKGLSATAVDPHRTKAWENGIWVLRRDQSVLIMDPRSERNENVSVREE